MNISVVSEESCSAHYDALYHPSMFCAGGGQDQKDSCKVRDGGRGERGDPGTDGEGKATETRGDMQ